MLSFPLHRDFRAFKDRPLDRAATPTVSRLPDLKNAVAAGIDALSLDLFVADKGGLAAFGQLVDLIRENQLPLQLSPMFDGFSRPGVTADQIVARVQAWFQQFANERCVVRYHRKPVVFTFGASSLTPETWWEILDRLHAAGCDGYWIAEMGRVLAPGGGAFPRAKPWLDLFAMGNVFRALDQERTRDFVSAYRKMCSLPPHQWVGDINIGYWRPEIAVYSSQRGTRQFRETWQAVNELGINWVQQTTWNDFGENHHIMPSENYSTAFTELNRYLAAQWKGKPEAIGAPRLYLSQQQEVLAGETAEFELIGLLRPQDAPATLQLWVTDGAGQEVASFAPVKLAQSGLQVAEFALPVSAVPAGKLLYPTGRLLNTKGKVLLTVRGPYAVISPAGYRPERSLSWLHTPDQRQLSGVGFELALDGKAGDGRMSFKVNSPIQLADVEILHDDVQILSLYREQEKSPHPAASWRGRLPLNRRGRLDWGRYSVRAVTVDGRTATSRPVFVDPPPEADVTIGLWTFDADSDSAVLDSSPWLHDGRLGGRTTYDTWRPKHVADAWGRQCLDFDGIDDRVLLEGPIFPPDSYTVEAWVKPAAPVPGSKVQTIFGVASGAMTLGLESDGALFVLRNLAGAQYRITDSKPLAVTQWQHVAATYDGASLRLYRNGVLVGEQPAPGKARSGQVSLGYNSVTNGSFFRGELDEVRVSARPLRPEQFGPRRPSAR